MDVYEAIISKRDTRSFSDTPVSEDDLRQILQAGRMAGSAKNQQLNRIVVVSDPGDRAKLAESGKFAEWIPTVPVVLVVVVPKDGGKAFDIGRMAQNMMVAAHGLGLASCPVTFHHGHLVRDLLGFPEDHDGSMGIGIGHPAPPAEKRKSAPRIPLDELVGRDRWKA